jgi:hypothetical protein
MSPICVGIGCRPSWRARLLSLELAAWALRGRDRPAIDTSKVNQSTICKNMLVSQLTVPNNGIVDLVP